MGKAQGKEKVEININPAEYDYMDNMPLEGWIWEFIRRKKEYQAAYKEIEKVVLQSLKNKTAMQRAEMNTAVTSRLNNELEEMSIRFCEVKDYRHPPDPQYFLNVPANCKIVSIPKPQTKYCDVDLKGFIRNVSPVRVMTFDDIIDGGISKTNGFVGADDAMDYGEYLLKALTITNSEDTIYVGISKEAKLEDVKYHLLPVLKEYLERAEVRVRDDKWKYYLIVYDLKQKYQKRITGEQIAVALLQAYPYITITKKKGGKEIRVKVESSDYFSSTNCNNFNKAALLLISGEYQKHLYQ